MNWRMISECSSKDEPQTGRWHVVRTDDEDAPFVAQVEMDSKDQLCGWRLREGQVRPLFQDDLFWTIPLLDTEIRQAAKDYAEQLAALGDRQALYNVFGTSQPNIASIPIEELRDIYHEYIE